jgi:hypothetical protein
VTVFTLEPVVIAVVDDDPQWILQSLPDLLAQAMKPGNATIAPRPEPSETPESTDEAKLPDEPEFDPVVDRLSNYITSELIESAPEVIESAKQHCENLDEAARARKIAAAQLKVLQIAAKLKGIGLCAEVVD